MVILCSVTKIYMGTSTPTLYCMGDGCFVLELVVGSIFTHVQLDHSQRTFCFREFTFQQSAASQAHVNMGLHCA